MIAIFAPKVLPCDLRVPLPGLPSPSPAPRLSVLPFSTRSCCKISAISLRDRLMRYLVAGSAPHLSLSPSRPFSPIPVLRRPRMNFFASFCPELAWPPTPPAFSPLFPSPPWRKPSPFARLRPAPGYIPPHPRQQRCRASTATPTPPRARIIPLAPNEIHPG